LSFALPLIDIYIYSKFDLNDNNSFKLFAGQCTGTDGQSGDHMLLPPSEEHSNTCKTYIYNYMQCLISNIGLA